MDDFTLQLVMLSWRYFSIVIMDPGGYPPNWVPELDEERDENPLVTSEECEMSLVSKFSAYLNLTSQ